VHRHPLRIEALAVKTIWCTLVLAVLAVSADAANYTVKSGGGGNYTTIQACANVAVAGDTCTIYAGSYAGWTQPASGSSTVPITFTANTGDTVNVTGTAAISSRSYITISSLNFTSTSAAAVTGNGSSSHNIITHNTSVDTLFYINYGLGSGGSDNYIGYNVVDLTGHTDNSPGFWVYGDRNLFEHNEIKNGEGDCHDLGGTNVVVRYEYCHDMNGASGEHIDFVQVIGGFAPTLSFSLIEDNIEQHCYNDGGNCHFTMVRASGGQVADTLIVRYNYQQNIDGSFGIYGDHNDGTNTVINTTVYNNTIATENIFAQNGGGFSMDAYGEARNNIFYNSLAGPFSPTYFNSGGDGNGDIAFTAGYSGSWNSPYSTEATYAALNNKDPLFANYPTDGTLQAGSPAIGAGVALTKVTSGCETSSLVVNDAHLFQPGWGPNNNKVQGDWIRVGSSAKAQISGINYSTNTLTLASSLSCSAGDPVWLYSDSTGTQVLFGAAPNIGSTFGSGVPPPTNLAAVPH
jgi:hypothetical protein